MGDASFARLIEVIKNGDPQAVTHQQAEFETANGTILDAYLCTSLEAGVAYTERDGKPKNPKTFVHFLWSAETDLNSDVTQILNRCQQLSLRLESAAANQKHNFLQANMRALYICAERLLGLLDNLQRDASPPLSPGPSIPSLCEGRGAVLHSVETDLDRIDDACQRLDRENGQTRYFSGVLWGVVPLFTLCACVLVGTYSWGYATSVTGFSSPSDQAFWDAVRKDPRDFNATLAILLGTILLLVLVTTPLHIWSNRQFQDLFDSESIPGRRDQILSWAMFEFIAVVLPVAIGFWYAPETLRPLIITLFAGGLGATISVIWRILSGKLLVDPTLTPRFLRLRGSFRFIVGAIFGTILFILLKLNIINVSGLAQATSGTVAAQGGQNSATVQAGQNANYLYFVFGLIAGFSERLVPSFLDRIKPGNDAGDPPPVRGLQSGTVRRQRS